MDKVTAVFKACDKSKSKELSGDEFDAFFEKLLLKMDREGDVAEVQRLR